MSSEPNPIKMALERIDKIEFDTGSGIKCIELQYGDITALPMNEKADMLMISAFHGDYVPTNTSLIGALHRKLSVSVGGLARDKEEDLRSLFHCWWSKPLPEHLPYGRILCFESSRSGVAPQKAVQAIFKALIPASSLFTKGVIVSPLLSTGNQGYSETQMLEAIIVSAIVWMKNGLDIKLFKLVIYKGDDNILQKFRDLKRKYARIPGSEMRFKRVHGPTKPIALYDFYLSYVPAEKGNVDRVRQLFLEQKSELKFFTPEDLNKTTTSEVAEDYIFTVMKTCSRVITFLSPSYLEDDDRVEEYNAAWCLNRQTDSITRLAPMLCQAIAGLPTYMSLIQWVDIRIQDGNTEKMIRNITLYMVGYVQEVSGDIDENKAIKIRGRKPLQDSSNAGDIADQNLTTLSKKYDYHVFISYAHANEPMCKFVIETLQKEIPGIKLFVDREGLRTGGSWQQKLYHAVESSQVTLALLSKAYVKSKMCNEEFRLSLARHFTNEDYHLVPIQIEAMEDLDDRYTAVRNSAIDSDSLESYIATQLTPAVKTYLSQSKCDGNFFPINKTVYSLSRLLEDGRCARLDDLIKKEPAFDRGKAAGSQIQILCSKEAFDLDIARGIKESLVANFGFQAHANEDYKDTATVMHALDDADLIVVLVSPDFLKDSDLIENLQVAINRQRYDKQSRLYPVLLSSVLDVNKQDYHVYCELLLYDLCFTDLIWESFTVDEIMERHPNYQEMMVKWWAIQHQFDEEFKTSDSGGNENVQLMKRMEKDRAKKQLKFVTAICNRVAYHISHQDVAENHEVLVDVFAIIKDVVLDKESLEKEKSAAIEKIGQSYQQNHMSQSTGHVSAPNDGEQKSTGGKENIQRLKENHQSSPACVLL